MKLFVALGPGDIVGAARSRLAGKAIPETSVAYSEQLFTYCRANSIETLAISAHPRVDQAQDGLIAIENRPKVLQGRGGLAFHFTALLYACYLAFRARRFNADLAIIDSGTTHYFLLIFFRLLGIQVSVNLHNVLWPVGFPPHGIHRIIRALDAWFFRNVASAAIGVSPECERQIVSESRGRIPFFQYRCQFLADGFRQSLLYKSGTFHIACVGRAEENKGFLDIAKIAESLRTKSLVPVVFHMCGDGPALAVLRQIVHENSLTERVFIYGHLQREELLDIYTNSHAVVIPTRSTFAEGLPKICAEAVLSGLPVITSPVSNAFDVIGPAVMRAETDNIESYVSAIINLISDHSLYKKLRAQCRPLSKQFLDPSQGYSAAVNRLIMRLFPKQA